MIPQKKIKINKVKRSFLKIKIQNRSSVNRNGVRVVICICKNILNTTDYNSLIILKLIISQLLIFLLIKLKFLFRVKLKFFNLEKNPVRFPFRAHITVTPFASQQNILQLDIKMDMTPTMQIPHALDHIDTDTESAAPVYWFGLVLN